MPDFLHVQIGAIIASQTPTASPRRENVAQYVNGSIFVSMKLILLAWFTFAKGIHGCMHRPTFESNVTTWIAPGVPPPWEFALLYYAVLAIGAYLLGETDRSYQFLSRAYNRLQQRMYQSQDLKLVQATYLLVCHLP